MAIPHNPDTLLRRDALAAALTEAGFPVAKASLATRATRAVVQRFVASDVRLCIVGVTPWHGRTPVYRHHTAAHLRPTQNGCGMIAQYVALAEPLWLLVLIVLLSSPT